MLCSRMGQSQRDRETEHKVCWEGNFREVDLGVDMIKIHCISKLQPTAIRRDGDSLSLGPSWLGDIF